MEKCIICRRGVTIKYWHGNHLKKINFKFLKHYMALLLSPIIRQFVSDKSYKLLFTQVLSIIKCKKYGHGHYNKLISQIELNDYYKKVYWFNVTNNQVIERKYNDRVYGQYKLVKNIKDLSGLEIREALFPRYVYEKPG